jgi:hypothetical protein
LAVYLFVCLTRKPAAVIFLRYSSTDARFLLRVGEWCFDFY